MWLNNVKLAVINQDFEHLAILLESMPQDTTLEQMQEASYLVQEALKTLHNQKDEVASVLVQLQKNRAFLQSTQNATSDFDITS